MVFRTRNCYYLRISERTVIPLYLYLDESHLEWISDVVLQHVIADLRPFILPKLIAEADAQGSRGSGKKSTVDTHRGDSYQFCYFVRNTEPHSLVIKTREYIAAQPKPRVAVSSKAASGKRKGKATSRKDAPTKKKQKTLPATGDDDVIDISDDEDDIYMPDSESDGSLEERLIIVEDEEEKPKPLLRLNYQGFNISGQCLCVVVEPWPPIKDLNKVASAKARLFGTAPPVEQSRLTAPPGRPTPAPPTREPTVREETPLFLPDDDTGTPGPEEAPKLYTMDSDDDDTFGGMIAFSQALKNAGDNRTGATNDEDEMDGSALFADADENREL